MLNTRQRANLSRSAAPQERLQIDGVPDLKRCGFKMGFITGEDTRFCDYVNQRFSPNFLVRGCKDKLAGFKKIVANFDLNKETSCYAGDSKKDIKLLEYVRLSYAPADAPPEVRSAAKKTLLASRGQGVIREMANNILEQNIK